MEGGVITLVCASLVITGVGSTLGCVSALVGRDGCTFVRVSKATMRGLGSLGVVRGGAVIRGGVSQVLLKFLKIELSCVSVRMCC